MRAVLRSISPDATPEEVAAIVAAIAASRPAVLLGADPSTRSRWLDTARRSARRAGLARGEWRLSGRINRRARA